MKRLVLLLASLMLLAVSGCAGFEPTQQQRDVEVKAKRIGQTESHRTVEEVVGPYLGAKAVKRHERKKLPLGFSKVVTLYTAGKLDSLVQRVNSLTTMKISLAPDTKELVAESSAMRLKWRGTLEGLLDALAAQYGVAWRYSRSSNGVVISRFSVKTFTLLAPPGKVSFEGTITNKSRAGSGASGGGAGGAQVTRTSDTTAETSQTSKTEYEHDLWEMCERTVKSFLTKEGRVAVNRYAGTVTVTDVPEVLRRVGEYIDQLNERTTRQVALTVKVWSLRLSDESEVGLDIQKLISSQLALTSGGIVYGALDGAGALTASIVGGDLQGSEMVARAMRQHGRTTLLTSGSAITMHNQPFPMQRVLRSTYLASVSETSSNDSQTTSSLQPGEVSTGFSLTIIPRILDQRRCILQYNVNLSELEDIKDFSSGGARIQLPQITSQSFSQRLIMKMGQTLVLAGFERESRINSKGLGLSSVGTSDSSRRDLIVITIDLESAGV